MAREIEERSELSSRVQNVARCSLVRKLSLRKMGVRLRSPSADAVRQERRAPERREWDDVFSFFLVGRFSPFNGFVGNAEVYFSFPLGSSIDRSLSHSPIASGPLFSPPDSSGCSLARGQKINSIPETMTKPAAAAEAPKQQATGSKKGAEAAGSSSAAPPAPAAAAAPPGSSSSNNNNKPHSAPLPALAAAAPWLPFRVAHSKALGRHAVATRDIAAGELLLVERAVAIRSAAHGPPWGRDEALGTA